MMFELKLIILALIIGTSLYKSFGVPMNGIYVNTSLLAGNLS